MRSKFNLLLAGLALCASLSAHAATFPSRTVNLVVGFTPGTSVDIIARILGQKLGEIWGQSVVVQNRDGAGGNIGAGYVARSAPDGSTILLANNSVAISYSLYRKLSYNPLHDLKAVTLVSAMPFALVVTPNLPANSVKELIALAKAKPGQLEFGSGGVGNTDHMTAELFAHSAGIQMTHVPYRGGTQAMTDVMSGRITMYFAGVAAALPFVADHKLKVIATSGAKRSGAMPEVPTFVESGMPDFKVSLWNGLMVPAGTPQPVIDKIAADVARVLQMPDVRKRFADLGLDVEPSSPAAFDTFFNAEVSRWAGVVKATGIAQQ